MNSKKNKGSSSESETSKATQGLLLTAQAELLRIDGMLLSAAATQIDEFGKYFAAVRK